MSVAAAVVDAQAGGYIRGVKTGAVEPRLEIDEFVLDRDMLNVFLLALIQLQDPKHYQEPWSWYQIAGIHGRPFADWDNVHGKHASNGGKSVPVFAGYCSHSSVTFPTWHRPYIAMMEQAVYVAMVGIAKQYTDHETQQKYLKMCDKFRFPYWDPCLPRQTGYSYQFGVPQIISSPQVWVRWPNSPETLVPVDNPLYSYKFPAEVQTDDQHDFHWETMSNTVIRAGGNKHTIRAPNLRAETTDVDVDKYLSDHIQADVGSSLYKVLTVSQDWTTFSNDSAPVDREQVTDRQGNRNIQDIYHTVEGFHDNIHTHIGNGALRLGSGHMGDPQLAAFDPIFCNIDRVTAIWQARNPSSWWNEHAMADSAMNWAVPAGHIERPSDPLLPFRNSKKTEGHDTYWTSDGVKNWQDLGYTYLGKRINRGASGQNELVSFTIALGANLKDLKAFCTQFYGWMDNSAVEERKPVPDLLYQFYPVDISRVEALTGKPLPKSVLSETLAPGTVVPRTLLQANPLGEIIIPEKVVQASAADGEMVSKRPVLLQSHPSRTPNDPIPNALYPDYSHLEGLMHEGCLRQWNAYITVEKFALRGSFQIFIFIGDFSQNPDDWLKDANLAGVNGIFASDPTSGGCSNCERQASSNLLVTDVVPLTAHLIKWIKNGKRTPENDSKGLVLKSLESSDVMPFLYKNMHWRIATIHGEHKERSEVSGLKVAVADQVVRLPRTFEDDPEYEDVSFQTRATHGREGGLDHNEAMAQVRIR